MFKDVPKRKPQGGFSLLEVLVAFAIAAIALTVTMRIYSEGFHLSNTSEDYSRATVLAESLLAQVGPVLTLDESPFTGDFDERFNWIVELEPFAVDDALLANNETVSLVKISLDIGWSEGLKERHYRLSSLRLIPSKGR